MHRDYKILNTFEMKKPFVLENDRLGILILFNNVSSECQCWEVNVSNVSKF